METESQKQAESRIMVIDREMNNEAFRVIYDATLPTTMRRMMPLDRAVNIIIRAIEKNPRLGECEPRSLQQCLLDSAALGLELCGPLHHAHAVPFKNNRKDVLEAQLIIGFQGYLELARRTGDIDGAPIVQWVRKEDNFKINFASHATPIIHEPFLDGPRGEPKLVYCLTWFKSGGYHFDFMSKSDIEEHRNAFAKKDYNGNFSDAWEDDFEEMGRKTIIRRASKHWPLSSEELAQAREVDEKAERGEREFLVKYAASSQQQLPDPTEAKPNGTRTDRIADKLSTSTPPKEPEKKVTVVDGTKKRRGGGKSAPASVEQIDTLMAMAESIPRDIIEQQILLVAGEATRPVDLSQQEADDLITRLTAFRVKK